jgi:hypothetical protein
MLPYLQSIAGTKASCRMRSLVTFPGRAGDAIWMLPTARAISEYIGMPVDLCLGGEFASLVPLFSQQPYLGNVWADPRWGLTPPNEWQHPKDIEEGYDRVWALGYRRWPELPLPHEVYRTATHEYALPLPPLDLSRPWITVEPWLQVPHTLAVGWTDCHFELKLGLMVLLEERSWDPPFDGVMLPPAGSRWCIEYKYQPVDWLEAARRIAASVAFLGDCSALHVLARAMAKPVILYEPMTARLNPIFLPYGTTGHGVELVIGLDGQATTDARHTAETIEKVLHAR